MNKLCVFLCLLPAVLGAHVDLSKYPLSQVLRDSGGEIYTLHWGFNVEEETIRFAVNVSTVGWVGLGLSPNGGMANSDVVIGWVNDNGDSFLDDRFATGQSRPPIDAEQNWFLDGGEEENGHTILAFRRDWVTCDAEYDRDVKAETARVIFSWNEADPVNDDPNGVAYHGMGNRGSVSINLLGAQEVPPPDPDDVQTFTTAVNNVNIPASDTTYWCSVHEIPAGVHTEAHYITRISPVITPGNEAYVSRILVYLCSSLTAGESGMCDGGVSDAVSGLTCRGGVAHIVAAWAVGERDFYFPADVAYPFGGIFGPRNFVVETRYDIPSGGSVITDSSGLMFWYTANRRTYDAGILQMGHVVGLTQLIPPRAAQFTTFAECSDGCTAKYFPDNGITVFNNVLQTHQAGVEATLHHYQRVTNPEFPRCDATSEVEPIDQNLQLQEVFTTLTAPITIKKGDLLRLECTYNTEDRDSMTFGGPATTDEMCLSFLYYYPVMEMVSCLSNPNTDLDLPVPFLSRFFLEHLSSEEREILLNAREIGTREAIENGWKSVLTPVDQEWTPEVIADFERDIMSGPQADVCVPVLALFDPSALNVFTHVDLANVDCSYDAPNQCNTTESPPLDCCARLAAGAPVLSASAVLIAFCLLCIFSMLLF